MPEQIQSPDPQAVQRLHDELEALRQAHEASGEDDRRQAFRAAIETAVEGLPDDRAQAVIDGVRGRILGAAREREQRAARAEQELAEVRARLEAVTAERDELRGAAGAAGAAAPGSLDRFREGLKQMTDEQDVSAESLGLPGAEARFFRMVQALLGFALNYEIAVNLLLSEFRIGPASEMDTELFQGYMRRVRERFRACLENKPGSIQALKEVLDRNSRFLIDLNTAYTASIYDGGRTMLQNLDPQPVLEQHKRMMGFNYEEAFQELSRTQNDLANLTQRELWGQFFYKPFREKLATYIDQQ